MSKRVLVINHAPNLRNFAENAAALMKEEGAAVALVQWIGFTQTHAVGNSEEATLWATNIINNLRNGNETKGLGNDHRRSGSGAGERRATLPPTEGTGRHRPVLERPAYAQQVLEGLEG